MAQIIPGSLLLVLFERRQFQCETTKTNQTSKRKCLAVFFMGNRWPLK